jgi:hypothetical protein
VDLIRTHENNVQDFFDNAGLLIVSASLSAHHGNAACDTAKVITTKANRYGMAMAEIRTAG